MEITEQSNTEASPIQSPNLHRLHNIDERKLGEIRVSGNDLKKAFRKLAPQLGQDTIEIITNQLEIRFLIVMHGQFEYSLAEIANALCNTLSESAGYMILDDLVQYLNIESN